MNAIPFADFFGKFALRAVEGMPPGGRKVERGQRSLKAPQAASGLTRFALKRQKLLGVLEIRREGVKIRVTRTDHFSVNEGSVFKIEISEGPAVAVGFFNVIVKPRGLALDELAVEFLRFAVIGAVFLRRVNADEAHVNAAIENNGVAIDHIAHRGTLGLTRASCQ